MIDRIVTVIALVLMGATIAHASPRFDTDRAEVCFPAEAWDANDNARPCVRVNVYEDGSYNAHTVRADGKKWRMR